jgi:hypothetical protein
MVEIQQRSLNTIIRESGLQNVDVLNIDVEGAELEILSSIDFDVFNPKVICVEIHAIDISTAYESEVAKILFSKGYRCVGSSVITYFFVR